MAMLVQSPFRQSPSLTDKLLRLLRLVSDGIASNNNDKELVLSCELERAVEVSTSNACSEDGLEDATMLLLQMSRISHATRDHIYQLLLSGVNKIGLSVCNNIQFVFTFL